MTGLFKKKPPAPTPEEPPPQRITDPGYDDYIHPKEPPPDPERMPDPNDPVAREQERLRLERLRRRGGRLDTILTQGLKRRAGIQ